MTRLTKLTLVVVTALVVVMISGAAGWYLAGERGTERDQAEQQTAAVTEDLDTTSTLALGYLDGLMGDCAKISNKTPGQVRRCDGAFATFAAIAAEVPLPDAIEGPRGADGDDGQDGRDGKDGLTGAQGKRGPRGLSCVEELGLAKCRGSSGADGDDGDTGRSGEPGASVTGAPGPAGPQGAPGKDGTNGQDGEDGRGIADVRCDQQTGEFVVVYDDGTSDTVDGSDCRSGGLLN